ncbi:MAG: hypothetical protein ACLTDV_06020 [Eubacterium sp.]
MTMFNTLVESQKLPIFSISGEPYNALLSRIALQAEVDVIVLGGMGLKYDDYLALRDTLKRVVPEPYGYVYPYHFLIRPCRVPPKSYGRLVVAGQFALNGKKVLVLPY